MDSGFRLQCQRPEAVASPDRADGVAHALRQAFGGSELPPDEWRGLLSRIDQVILGRPIAGG